MEMKQILSIILQMTVCLLLIHGGSCGGWYNKLSPNQEETQSDFKVAKNPESNWTLTYARQIARQKCEQNYTTHQYLLQPITPAADNYMLYRQAPILFDRTCDAFDEYVMPNRLEVAPRLHPHMARIGYRNVIGWQCSGTLISERFVLSAASCGKTSKWGPPKIASLGDTRKHPDNYLEKKLIGAQHRLIINVYDHPRYDPVWKRNDISIFELTREVVTNPYIRPACLLEPPPNLTFVSSIYATGYPRKSNSLIRMHVRDTLNTPCSMLYNSEDEFNTKYNSSTMICTQSYNNNPNAKSCMVEPVEPGGPLEMREEKEEMECMFTVVGVMTPMKNCLGTQGVAIYTKVDSYIDWIQSIVWPQIAVRLSFKKLAPQFLN